MKLGGKLLKEFEACASLSSNFVNSNNFYSCFTDYYVMLFSYF